MDKGVLKVALVIIAKRRNNIYASQDMDEYNVAWLCYRRHYKRVKMKKNVKLYTIA